LPRTEGTPPPARQIPEFTIRQNGGRSGRFRSSASHRHRPAGPGSHSGDGSRHAGRSGMQGGRGGNRPSSQPHRPAHPHGTRTARPGKKRSRKGVPFSVWLVCGACGVRAVLRRKPPPGHMLCAPAAWRGGAVHETWYRTAWASPWVRQGCADCGRCRRSKAGLDRAEILKPKPK
jgi:hypothetical protein